MAPIVGRYAPSPTGDLHFGSLLAAVASYCQARAMGGQWRLRIDDLDTTRVVSGKAERILATLAAFGLHHDGELMYQSARRAVYARAIDDLKSRALAFDCGCTRRESRQGPMGSEGPIYPGTCRDGVPAGREPRSVRVRVDQAVETLTDAVQGVLTQDIARDIGDFVIRRGDGLAAYQLATVLDDAAQGVTQVVRGADLLHSSPRQRWLQRRLALPLTDYAHIPTVVDADGEKLGKSNGAMPLDAQHATALIHESLTLLGQAPPNWRAPDDRDRLLGWAVAHWSIDAVPSVATITRDPAYQRS